MKECYFFYFFLCSSLLFSQKVTITILDLETNTSVERAHVFFINKTTYSDENGTFSFQLDAAESIEFSVTHLKYQTKKVVYKWGVTDSIIFLKERKETLASINISSRRKLKLALDFEKMQDLPAAVYSFGSVIYDDKIYIFGGDTSSAYEKNKEGLSQVQFSNEAEIMQFLQKPKPIGFNNYIGHLQWYDMSEKNWNIEKDRVISRAYHKAIVNVEDIFLIGGKMLSKKKSLELLCPQIENFSLSTFSIKEDEANPHQAVNFGAAVYEDKLVVFGGSLKQYENGRVKYSDEIHFFDIKTGFWYLLTKMFKGKETTGIVFEDTLYLFGGYNKKNLTEIESFNLKTGIWKKEGDLFRGMKKPAITKDNEFIYLQEDGKIVTFNPISKRLKEYKIDLNLKASEMHYYNESLYIVGGFQVEDYRKAPSDGFYKIEVLEFFKTEPMNIKKL